MLAVIMTGGKQYKVKPEQVINVERLKSDEGEKVTFDQVLLIEDGKKTLVGSDCAKAVVTATVLKQDRDKKISVVKFKRRKRYMRNKGHRQHFTQVKIEGIQAAPAKKKAASQPKAESEE